MKTKLLLLHFLVPLFVFAQTQIGADIDGEAGNDLSGTSVSLSADGSIVAIGAPENDGNGTNSGHVRVYQNIGGTWSQIGQDIDGEAAIDRSGWSVSLSADGSILAIGAYLNGGNGHFSGHVRIYQNSGGTWTQIGEDIDGEAAEEQSGNSVSLSTDGSIVAIGAPGKNVSRIYQNTGGAWTQVGADIDGEAPGDSSGKSVSLSADGSIVAIGATMNIGNGNYAGHVRIYQNTGGAWTQIGQDINGEGGGGTEHFGKSVSLSADGSIVAIGAPENDGNGNNSGHVRVYQNTGGTWTQIGEDIDGESAGDESGISVSLSDNGSIVAIGAWFNNGNGFKSGQVRIYQNTGGAWTQIGVDIDGEGVGDQSGTSVGLSADGSIVAIGAPKNQAGNGNRLGHVRVFDLSGAPANNECDAPISITSLFGGPVGSPLTGGPYDNTTATTEPTDPTTGFECFGEPNGSGSNPTLENTLWFVMVGDGNNYQIITTDCGGGLANYIDDGDTQMAIYTGNCGALVPEACNEDISSPPPGEFPAGFEQFQTAPGTTYFIMIDGFNFNGAISSGEYCVEVTRNSLPGIDDVTGNEFGLVSVSPNPVSSLLQIEISNALTRDLNISIMSINGQEVFYQRITSSAGTEIIPISVEDLASGMYILRISDEQAVTNAKFVVE